MNWNGLFGILSNDQEHAEYEDVYNENGDAVYCDSCGEEIGWKDGVYFCMGCGCRLYTSSSTFTSTPNGHASLHLPQPTQSFLLIV